MKRPLLFFFLVLGLPGFAQEFSSDLAQTWYLAEQNVDLGPTTFTFEIEPPIEPYITFDEELNFTGYASCNSFSGTFVVGEETEGGYKTYSNQNFTQTTNECESDAQTYFENGFLYYISDTEPDYFTFLVYTNSWGTEELVLKSAPGFSLILQNKPLSVAEKQLNTLQVYPIPAKNELFVNAKGLALVDFQIYSLQGKLIASEKYNSEKIDVSSLSPGVYFLNLKTPNGKTVRKFVKR